MAYTYEILPNSGDEHQVSPSYVLTFLRWENRDTVNFVDEGIALRQPLVVISDAISINIQDSKSGVTPAVTIVLKGGDINYATAVGAGDFFTVNLTNSEEKAIEVYQRALSNQAVNRFNDGFKGLFKVQKVRRKISQDPNSGTRSVTYIIHGFGFTEFNSVMYYDPVASTQFNDELFLSQFQKFFSGLVSSYENESNIQALLKIMCQALIGVGLNQSDFHIKASQNTQFLIPEDVGKLLNIREAKHAIDIYKVYLGIWEPSSGSTPAQGFNPSVELYPKDKSFYKAGSKVLKGYRILGAENWNMVQIFSILSSWANTTINELYTASARVGIDGYVYPALIIRQKPFSSPKLNTAIEATKFLDLPRWRISPKLMNDFDVGKDEVGRINFVQIYTQSIAANASEDQAAQLGLGNYFYDQKDIQRHGLRPFSATASFDYPGNTGTGRQAKIWAELLFDMMNAGQNRESGTMSAQGIVEPICVGDNLEFDGNVYHIEQVSHTFSVDQMGRKSFKTNLVLSFGTPDSKKIRYSQMDHTDSNSEKKRDEQNEQIMPGFSDTQSLPNSTNRSKDGEELSKTPEKSFNKGSLSQSNRRSGQATRLSPKTEEEKK